jgi:hypothetical protein
MTPTEYATRMDELLHYVGSLLVAPQETPEWQVGRTFALLPDNERLTYVRHLSADGTGRVAEIGWDLRAIILGWPESGAAA